MAKAVSDTPDPVTTALPTWESENANALFEEIVRVACEQGPQRVTVRGQVAVVVLSAADYARLAPDAVKPTLFALFADSSFARLESFDGQLAPEKPPVRDAPDFGPMIAGLWG